MNYRITRADIYQELLKATADRPLNRMDYCRAAGITPELFRGSLAYMRDMGIRVVSHSDGSGYWIARSTEEYLEWREREMAKIALKYKRISAMDSHLPGQQEVSYADLL